MYVMSESRFMIKSLKKIKVCSEFVMGNKYFVFVIPHKLDSVALLLTEPHTELPWLKSVSQVDLDNSYILQ